MFYLRSNKKYNTTQSMVIIYCLNANKELAEVYIKSPTIQHLTKLLVLYFNQNVLVATVGLHTTDGLGEGSGVVVVGIDLYWGSVVVAKAESSVITALTARGKVALCIMHLHLARINCNYHHVNRYKLVNLPSWQLPSFCNWAPNLLYSTAIISCGLT